MTDRDPITTNIEAVTSEEVVAKMKDLEPFIPNVLMGLHKAPTGDRKIVSRYRKGSVGPCIPESFSVNASTTDILGISVGLGEYSHTTGYDTWKKENKYTPGNMAVVNITFENTDDTTMQNASEILSFPESPEGYTIRHQKSHVASVNGSTSVVDAIKANLQNERTKPVVNRFATKYIQEIGIDTVWVHVNIGGGEYTQSVYYDKI